MHVGRMQLVQNKYSAQCNMGETAIWPLTLLIYSFKVLESRQRRLNHLGFAELRSDAGSVCLLEHNKNTWSYRFIWIWEKTYEMNYVPWVGHQKSRVVVRCHGKSFVSEDMVVGRCIQPVCTPTPLLHIRRASCITVSKNLLGRTRMRFRHDTDRVFYTNATFRISSDFPVGPPLKF